MSKPHKVITIQPFDFDLGVFRSVKSFEKFFAKMTDDYHGVDCADAFACRQEIDGRYWFSIVIPKPCSKAKQVHEVSHIVDYAMEAAGVPIGVDNTEIRAYMIERILDQLWQ